MTNERFQRRYAHFRTQINRRLSALTRSCASSDLAEGCRYVLLSGGKRVRASLVLLSAEAVGGHAADALHAAAATEILHNFTLVHDDIMDHAVTRRGKPTVHKKWNVNYALLVGDILVGLAYHSLLRTHSSHTQRTAEIFTKGLLEVCDGQARDLSYEKATRITPRNYFTMIEKKTARLFAMAAELGAVVGGGTPEHIRSLRIFGHYLGRAFQVQDDLLDVVADEQEFGKIIGGDIRERKKTFLWLQAIEHSAGREKQTLQQLMNPRLRITQHTVSRIARLYRTSGAIDRARMRIYADTRKATAALRALPRNEATEMLRWFSEQLVHRVS
jgi:geranylgeranyl diphosphate synthase type II